MTGQGDKTVPPRVFISYANDNGLHAAAVREFWLFLRENGVDAKLDRSFEDERQDWPVWMRREIDAADFVLAVASPTYRERADGDAPPGVGRGAGYEGRLLRERVYADPKAWQGRILPVVLAGESVDGIPEFLSPYSSTRFDVPEFTVAAADSLLRVILGRPAYPEPPLGSPPDLTPRIGGGSPTAPPTNAALVNHVRITVEQTERGLQTRTELEDVELGVRVAQVPDRVTGIWEPRPTAERLAQCGRLLRDTLFDAAVVEQLSQLMSRSPVGTVTDIEVVIDDQTANLPFETLVDGAGHPVVLQPGVRMSRRLSGIERPPAPPSAGPLNILAAVAAPTETSTGSQPLDVEAEMEAVLDAVAGLVGNDAGGAVRMLEVASCAEIVRALQHETDRYHVLHLSAHGSAAGIELENEDGESDPVSAADLVNAVRAGGRRLPLVLLSSCSGAADPGGGLARALIAGGVDRVIAMQAAISDGYATDFAHRLYRELTEHPQLPVGDVVARARRAL